MIRRIRLRSEVLRLLTPVELGLAAGGRPTSFPQCGAPMRGTTSEAEGAGPCPGEYSWTCSP